MAKPLNKPNGKKVSQAELYKALYQLDQNVAEAITAVHDAINGLRESFEGHRADGHPYTDKATIIKEQIGLDAKKAGLATGILAVAATFGAAAMKALDLVL